MAAHEELHEEYLDVLTKTGEKTGISKPRNDVHRDGDYHRAVHIWIYAESTRELLLQQRGHHKDVLRGLWDISSAGHVSAGESSLSAAARELQEELGISLPQDAFELIFVVLQESSSRGGTFINNEYDDVYLVTTLDPIPLEAFTLQRPQVSAVKYVPLEEYRDSLAREDPNYVPHLDVNGQYGQLFEIIWKRYNENMEARSLTLQKQLYRYSQISLRAELTGLTDADKEALKLIVKAAAVMDDIFYLQRLFLFIGRSRLANPSLRDSLKVRADKSQLDKLKWMYYLVNKSPWSCLDENEAFLTTADSDIKLLPQAMKPLPGWKGLEYRTASPVLKAPGANFCPPDMDKREFEAWNNTLSDDQRREAAGLFNVITRKSPESSVSHNSVVNPNNSNDLCIVPYSLEYESFLAKAANFLHKAGDLTSSPSLKRLLHGKADSFLSNDYYDSDIAWLELATFEAFVGVRDDKATEQVKLFGDHLQVLEKNLPMDDAYKSENVIAAPIRVIQLLYNSGDVKVPQTVALNLPKDERIVKDRGTSMVMLKNVSEAKFKLILQPIADVCISEEQRHFVDFDSFFTHKICHECCHGIGPHTVTFPNGKKSTVRLELQELYSALEEAKADIVGLWALKFPIDEGLLPKSLIRSMYVSFLAGCFRSVRFGLEEAHGKGQALQFNYLFEKVAITLHPDETFSVNFDKVEHVIESLSMEILMIQARGDKAAARMLLNKYCVMTETLKNALRKLELVQVPVDIAPRFPIADQILQAPSEV